MSAPTSFVGTASPNAPAESLPVALKLGWGIGSMGTSTLVNAINLLGQLYFITVVGLSPALAGTLIFLSKAFDIITDPVMGVVSDRTRSRWGRRRPWMLAGAAICGVVFALLFAVPGDLSQTMTIVYVSITLMGWTIGYTMFNVPYMAMPVEMSDSYHERTSLMSYRVLALSLGGIIGAAIAPRLVDDLGGGATGFARMGLVIGIIIFAALAACVFGTAKARSFEHTDGELNWRGQITAILRNRPFMLLMGIKLTQLFGLATYTTSLAFLITVLLDMSLGTFFYIALFGTGGTVISIPLWMYLSRTYGKRVALAVAIVMKVVVFLTWLAAGLGEPLTLIMARGFLAGVASGGVLLVAISMVPDTMQYDFLKSGEHREGMLAALYSLIEKVGFALGPLVVGIVLELGGFIEGTTDAAAQPASALTAIYIAVALIPALAFALSLIPLKLYTLDEQMLEDERAKAATNS